MAAFSVTSQLGDGHQSDDMFYSLTKTAAWSSLIRPYPTFSPTNFKLVFRVWKEGLCVAADLWWLACLGAFM